MGKIRISANPKVFGQLLICAIAACAALSMAGCLFNKEEKAPEVTTRKPAESMKVMVGQKEYGTDATCAVTGKSFKINKDSQAAIFQGRKHYFRDEYALKVFLEAPLEYMPGDSEGAAEEEAKP